MKSNRQLGRNYLKDRSGDQINIVLSAASGNFRLIPRWLKTVSRLICFANFCVTTLRPAANSFS